jgi:NAD(P)-dependent dehydrogenase (short-subunit alcohol dehydrogenase family)
MSRGNAGQPLTGKVALVTGAASPIGLGRAMTEALVGAGARVAMLDVEARSLAATGAELREMADPASVATITSDVSKIPRTVLHGPSKAAHEALVAAVAGDVAGTGVTCKCADSGSGCAHPDDAFG